MPLSKVYGGAIGIRNKLFDSGVFKEKRFQVPVISVGNLSVGGTGKTAVVAHFVAQFKSSGKKVCIVTRGYGGSFKEDAARVDVTVPWSAAIYGDEPVWFARFLDVPVYVGPERSKAVELCLSEQTPDVIIADDGFQHRWLGRDRDLVLLDATEKSPALLPMGRFREPISSLKRADYVFLTKTNLAGEEQTKFWLKMAEEQGFSSDNGNLFVIEYELGNFKSMGVHKHFPGGESVLLASAIARPQSFEQLVSKEAHVLKHFIYSDHHPWSQDDVDKIAKFAKQSNCNALVVTEKDYVKLSDLDLSSLIVFVAPLEITLHPPFPYEKLFD
jgi:tetraacyldisaccharide 4'-kinase